MRTRSSAASRSTSIAAATRPPSNSSLLKRRRRRRRRGSLSSSSDDNDTQTATMMETMQMTDAAMESLMHGGPTTALSAPVLLKSAPPTPPQQQSALLALPVEILMLIAEYSLPATNDPADPALSVPISIYCACSGTNHLHRAGSYCYTYNLTNCRSAAVAPCTALLRTCRALYSVTRAVLYHHTVFHFTEKARTFPALPPADCPAYNTLALHSAHAVRAIKLSIDLHVLLDPSAWLHQRLLLLRDLFPNLHSLALEILPPPMAHSQTGWVAGQARRAPTATPAAALAAAQNQVFDALADPLLRRCCSRLTVSTCLGRFEHRWTFATTVGGHTTRPAKKPRRHAADSSASSYTDFCEAAARAERQRMREQLAFLPRWIKTLAEQEHELARKRNMAGSAQADVLKRKTAVDSNDMVTAMQLLESVHTTKERPDWWWW